MRVALLCSLLLPLAQGTIMSVTATDFGPPFELDLVDPLTGQLKKIVDTPADGFPHSGVLRNDNTFTYCDLLPFADGSLTTVDLSTGKIQQQRSPNVNFNGVGFDKVTNQTFVVAQNKTTARYPLFELLPNQTLRTFMELNGWSSPNLNTYSSSKHIFFFGAPTTGKPFTTNVVAVSTVGTGKILYNVSVGLGLASLMYDDTFGVLYVWGTDSTNCANLVSLDFATGTILKTFIKSPSFTVGPACINKEGTVIYSSLFDFESNHSMIHSLEVSSDNATQVPTDRLAIIMTCQ